VLLTPFPSKDLMMGGDRGLEDGLKQKAAGLLCLSAGTPGAESRIWPFA